MTHGTEKLQLCVDSRVEPLDAGFDSRVVLQAPFLLRTPDAYSVADVLHVRHVVYGHVLKMHQAATSRLVSESTYSYIKQTALGRPILTVFFIYLGLHSSFSSPALSEFPALQIGIFDSSPAFSAPANWSV